MGNENRELSFSLTHKAESPIVRAIKRNFYHLIRHSILKTSKMKNLCLLSLLIVLFVSGCGDISHGPGERNADAAKGGIHSMSREVIPKLVGSWKLISFHSQDSSGRTAYPFGKDAQGRITYEPNGRMAVQLMDPNRPRFTSGDPLLRPRPKYGRRSADIPPTTGPIQSIRTNRPSCTTSRPPSSPTGWGRISSAISNSMGSI